MSEKWTWVPDWASDLSLWEDYLVDVSPSADHVFVSYPEMAAALDDIFSISCVSKASTVVGWGLGALALMNASEKRPKGQKWILLSPFADFCDESSEWTVPNLNFMAHQLHVTIEPALNAFMEQYDNDFGDWQDDWLANAKKYDADSLAKGLEFLTTHHVEEPLKNGADIQVLYGKMDSATTPEQTLKLKAFLPQAEFKERPKAGHWPPMLLL